MVWSGNENRIAVTALYKLEMGNENSKFYPARLISRKCMYMNQINKKRLETRGFQSSYRTLIECRLNRIAESKSLLVQFDLHNIIFFNDENNCKFAKISNKLSDSLVCIRLRWGHRLAFM